MGWTIRDVESTWIRLDFFPKVAVERGAVLIRNKSTTEKSYEMFVSILNLSAGRRAPVGEVKNEVVVYF